MKKDKKVQKISVRINQQMYDTIKEMSKQESRTFANMAEVLIKKGIEKIEKESSLRRYPATIQESFLQAGVRNGDVHIKSNDFKDDFYHLCAYYSQRSQPLTRGCSICNKPFHP